MCVVVVSLCVVCYKGIATIRTVLFSDRTDWVGAGQIVAVASGGRGANCGGGATSVGRLDVRWADKCRRTCHICLEDGTRVTVVALFCSKGHGSREHGCVLRVHSHAHVIRGLSILYIVLRMEGHKLRTVINYVQTPVVVY